MKFRLLIVALVIGASCAHAAAQDGKFAAFTTQLWPDAQAKGIARATFDLAMAGVTPDPRVIAATKRQPEYGKPVGDYVNSAVSKGRIARGQAKAREWSTTFDAVEKKFGVERWVLVALWGMETDFGHFPGDFPVLASLATLAYDGRRAALFERELIAALRIIQRDGIPPSELRGSWAGAMGQCQFMPSSFLQYAVSYRGTGRPDIWTDRADVLASIANYLARLGWNDRENWGRMVQAPAGLPVGDIGLGVRKPLTEWRRLGVTNTDGGPLPQANLMASLLLPEGEGGPALLVYGNFRTLLRWNNSQAFATSVGLLADDSESR